MPTNLPQRRQETSFASAFVCACILVPMVYGIVAYDVIAHEKLTRASGDPLRPLSMMMAPDVRR